jgi:hypothetical protein
MPWAWLALATIAFAGFALVVNAMLERSRDTGGRSEAAPNVTSVAGPGPAHDEPRQNTEASDSDHLTTQTSAPAGRLIYKCVSSNGATSYQSVACEDAQAFRKVIIAVPDDPGVVARGRLQQTRTANAARTLSRMAGTDHVAHAFPDIGMDDLDRRRAECNAAKASRESTLRAVGLARTYELLQKLDEQVREACKGV